MLNKTRTAVMIRKTRLQNQLIIAVSEHDADLYYLTRFLAPDSFVFIRTGRKKYLLMNDLEVDRARAAVRSAKVLSLSLLAKEYEKKYGRKPGLADIVENFLKRSGARHVDVPKNFPLGWADLLRKRGIRLKVKPGLFCGERLIKTADEIRCIRKALRHTEHAAGLAIKTLKHSTIRNGRLYFRGKPLTSGDLKKIIRFDLMENGLTASGTIVASGQQSVNPHEEGSGPLKAHQPIIIDIFPRDSRSRYYADFTRTVVRGKASPRLKKMYAAVRAAQALAFRKLKHGTDGREIHEAIHSLFEKSGFKTGLTGGRMQGFFHSTGHGLGLEIHEPPRIGPLREILKAGEVVTVEPGLYYEGAGGVRLEDVALITRQGAVNLTRFPKVLEI